jgi:uncharacterized protein YgiM (DUF1202 family)
MMKKSTYLLFAAGLSTLLLANACIAAEMGSALKNDNMRLEPFSDAKVAGSFSRGDSLEILKKQGAWLQVKSKNAAGWVRLLSVKRSSSIAGGNQAAGVLAAASGRAGTGQVVSTTGIRGLSEEDLKAAKFNELEVKQLESYTQSAEQGSKFARAGNLKTIAFANLNALKGDAK